MVFRTAWDSALITSIVSKWRAFSFIFHWGKQKKGGWVGGNNHVVSGKKNSLVKSVRQYFVRMQQPVLFVAKAWDKVFSHFHAVTIKGHNGMRN
jgi:hypothetical protein